MKIEGGSRGRMDPGGGKVLDREWVQEEDGAQSVGPGRGWVSHTMDPERGLVQAEVRSSPRMGQR